jgi:hypothetical protein
MNEKVVGKFETGKICISGLFTQKYGPDAHDWYPVMMSFLMRHANMDWGDLTEIERLCNDLALERGERILSSYATDKGSVWIVTEGDRSVTTVLLPEEYQG